MKKKIIISSAIKTILVQFVSALSGIFLPLPAAYCTSIILCVFLGLWLFGEFDSINLFVCIILTAIGAVAIFGLKALCLLVAGALLTGRDVPWLESFTDFHFLLFSVPLLSGGYWAVLLDRADREG